MVDLDENLANDGEGVREPLGVTDIERRVYSVEETRLILGISRATAYMLIREGTIPGLRLGRRWVVPMGALMELLGE